MIAPLAALKRGFWKKCMSSIGWLERSSQVKKHASRIAPITKPPMMTEEPHPRPGASITDQSNEPSATIDSSAPTGSSFPCDGSRDSGMSA